MAPVVVMMAMGRTPVRAVIPTMAGIFHQSHAGQTVTDIRSRGGGCVCCCRGNHKGGSGHQG
jgi:hypothetical protein